MTHMDICGYLIIIISMRVVQRINSFDGAGADWDAPVVHVGLPLRGQRAVNVPSVHASTIDRSPLRLP